MKKNRLFILLTFLPLFLSTYAYNLRHISNIGDLSNNSIESLYQDHKGQLWIGTCDGLNAFNGRDIYIYRPTDNNKRLSGNIIDNILETTNNTLWVQTYHGLNKIERITQDVTHYNDFNESLLMLKDTCNTLFVLQQNNFIEYYNEEKRMFQTTELRNVIFKNILCTTIDANNNLWTVSSTGEIKSFKITYSENDKIQTQQIYQTSHFHPIKYAYHSNNEIFIVDDEYNLYCYKLSLRHNDFLYNIKNTSKTRGELSSIIRNKEDILIAYKTSGIVCLSKDKNSSNYKEQKLNINCGVFSLLKDKKQDFVWIGTDGQGLYIYSNDAHIIRTSHLKDYHSQVGRPVRAIHKDKNNTLWIGTKGDGIIRFTNYNSATTNKGKEQDIQILSTKNSDLYDNSVYCIEKSNKNILWLGTEHGLNYFSYQDNKIKKANIINNNPDSIKHIHDLYESDSTLWLATVGFGIIKAKLSWQDNTPTLSDIKHITINQGEFTSNYFFDVFPENDSTLWFSNRGYGVVKLNTKTEDYSIISFSKEKNDKTLDEVFITTKKNNKMYFGTSGGLIEYKDTIVDVINNHNGFPNNTIHSILKDPKRNKLWLSTNQGLIHFDLSKNNFRIYGLNDGLGVVEFSDGAAYQDPQTGEVLFGGVNGFVSITGNKHNESTLYMPPITFDDLYLYGEHKNIFNYLKDENSTLKLKHKENFFTLSFNAIDYLNANNYVYYYKIDGMNNKWINNGNLNTISITNIKHGKYTLLVKYVNRITGQTSEKFSLPIIILPPWYQTNTAYIFYGLLIVLLIIGGAQKVQANQNKKREKLIRSIEAGHKEDLYESKLNFFTNIAHEFCTPLTLIHGPCNQILNNNIDISKAKQYAEIINKNAQRLNKLIQELIKFRRVETENQPVIIQEVNVSDVLNEIIFAFKEHAQSNDYRFYEKVPKNIIWDTDIDYLNTIIINLLSNAFKYTFEKGTVKIGLDEIEDTLEIKISNTGKGIKEKNIQKIFDKHLILESLENETSSKIWTRNGIGLATSSSMVKALKGEIRIESELNEWTHFTIVLPKLEKNTEIEELPILEQPSIDFDTKNIEKEILKKQELEKIDKNKQTILIIDDEIDILWFLSEVFTDEYNVITLTNPLDANSILDDIYPDIIICDINMPEVDGFTMTQKIKNDKKTSHIPIIIISAKQNIDDQIKGIESGAEIYLTKPFDIEFLKSSVQRLMSRKKELKEYFASPLSAFELDEGNLIHSEDHKMVKDIQLIIEENILDPNLNAELIAKKMNISIRSFYRKLNEIGCKNISDMVRDARLYIAESLLIKTKKTIDEIITDSGFSNRGSFYNAFSKKNACTPTEFRKTHEEEIE